MSAPASDPADRLAGLWWRRLPRALAHLSSHLAAAATDGLYLAVFPKVAAVATPLCFAAALVIGAVHPGFRITFTEAPWLIGTMIALGMLSAHLGASFLLGYALGDYALHAWRYSGGWLGQLSHLVQYGLMALALVSIPLLGKYLAADLAGRVKARPAIKAGLAVASFLFATQLLLFSWMSAVPQLIRSCYLWIGVGLSMAPMAPLQRDSARLMDLVVRRGGGWPFFLKIALGAALLRLGLQAAASMLPRFRPTYDRAVRALVTDAQPWAGTTLARVLSLPLRAAWATLMLSGIYDRLQWAWWIFAASLLVGGLRLLPWSLPLGRWPERMARLPLLARLVGTMAALYLLAYPIARIQGGGISFAPLLTAVLLGMLLFAIVNPSAPGKPQPAQATQ